MTRHVGQKLVWYVGYGSNTDRTRFLRYFADAVSTDTGSVGERVIAERWVWVDHDLYFAGQSKTWNGPPAFVELTRSSSERATVGHAYLITIEDAESVIAQENGVRTLGWKLPVDEIPVGG